MSTGQGRNADIEYFWKDFMGKVSRCFIIYLFFAFLSLSLFFMIITTLCNALHTTFWFVSGSDDGRNSVAAELKMIWNFDLKLKCFWWQTEWMEIHNIHLWSDTSVLFLSPCLIIFIKLSGNQIMFLKTTKI